MNLFDSSFLSLDIGAHGVRAMAHRVRSGRIFKSATHSCESSDIVFAIKTVIDEVEQSLGRHFDEAFVTGDFGELKFDMSAKNSVWSGEHKITHADVRNQIGQITPPDGFYPMHIIPMRYWSPTARDMATPIGHTDRQLISVFGTIFHPRARLDEINAHLRAAHIQAYSFFDPQFLHNAVFRDKKTVAMFIDIGANATTASIWTDRGPVWMDKIDGGDITIARDIADKLHLEFGSALSIMRAAGSLRPTEMDRFTPADTAYDFSRADINDILIPHMSHIISEILRRGQTALTKYRPARIYLTGRGAELGGITEFFADAFAIPVKNLGADATVRALADHIWAMEEPHRAAYLARHEKWARRGQYLQHLLTPRRRKPRRQFIPIMPSTLCFDMSSPATYSLFAAGGISTIHVDIMDGFYVDAIAGGISDLRQIRAQTTDHLHVHLMTESPAVWAADAIDAGADTVIVSTNTAGVRAALRHIRAAGKRCGVALNPDTPVTILKPILREIDEVMIMSVRPGAAGQPFNDGAIQKIAALNAARKKFNLKLTISVDGGIDAATAQKCWAAGADLLVSGSYLAHSADFPLAVRSLLPQKK